MDTLKIDGKDIEYTEELAPGMYKVTDAAAVARNCAALNIHISIPADATHVETMASTIGRVGCFTLCGNDMSIQFLFTPDADAKDFEIMLTAMPPQSHELFRVAFSASR